MLYAITLSWSLPTNSSADSLPSHRNMVIRHIRISWMGIYFPIQRYMSCTSTRNCLTQAVLGVLLLKCDTLNMFNKPDRCNPFSCWCGSNIVPPLSRQWTSFRYLLGANCGYFFWSLNSLSSNFNYWIVPSNSPSNGIFSRRNGVNVPYFVYLESLTGLALGFLGGKYGGSRDKIVALSTSIRGCSTSSSLSLTCWTSSYGSTRFLGFLSCFFFVLCSKVNFFLSVKLWYVLCL